MNQIRLVTAVGERRVYGEWIDETPTVRAALEAHVAKSNGKARIEKKANDKFAAWLTQRGDNDAA